MNQIITKNRSDNALEIMGMKINNLTEAITIANYFAKSDLVPKDYKNKPGNIVVAWQKGYEVGLMPQQSLETIAVINGRACIWGDGLIALVKSNPKEEWTKEWTTGQGDAAIAYCETKRLNEPTTIKASFSVAQAKTAGLWGNNTWKKYPKRMLQMRARGFAFRDAYPDVLNGLQLAEEQQDAEKIGYVYNIEEIEEAVVQLGLSLIKKNGIATVSGNTFENAKSLKKIGFEMVNNQWIIHYEDIVETSVVESSNQIETKSTKITPARELFHFLTDNGLDSKTVGKFVTEELELSSKNLLGCAIALENKDALLKKVNTFLTPMQNVQSNDVNLNEIF